VPFVWKNTVEPDRPQMKIYPMRITRWKSKATNTHPEYVMLAAFPRQQWLCERAIMLLDTYFRRPLFRKQEGAYSCG